MTKGRPEWFNSKRFGFGAGLPCSWQGWLVLAIYMAIAIGASLLFAETQPLVLAAILFPITTIFILIVAKTTRGGWKWRWGKDESTW